MNEPESLGKGALRALARAFTLLALAFLILEVGLRLANVASSQRVDQTAFSGILGDLKPNQDEMSLEIPHLAYHVRTNSQGLRGEEILPPDAVDKRMLMLGDSFVFGQFVNEEQTLAAQTVNLIHQAMSGLRLQIINAGRCGYSIHDELSYYEDKGRQLKASTVILIYTVGDEVEKAWGWQQRKQSLERGKFRSGHSPLLLIDRLLRKSAAIYWLQERYWKWILHSGFPVDSRSKISFYSPYEIPLSARYRQALEAYRGDLTRLATAVHQDGAQLLLVLFPSYLQMDPQAGHEGFEVLLQYAAELHIPTLDLLPVLRGKGSVETLYFSPEK